MKVLMHSNSLNVRGTTGALVNYANQLILMGHNVTIAYCETDVDNDLETIAEIAKTFQILSYSNFRDFALNYEGDFDLGYFIKAGKDDGRFFTTTRSVIHCVFQYFEPHGDSYAYVSEWLANRVRLKFLVKSILTFDVNMFLNSFKQNLWVPHIVSLPSPNINVRSKLGIPLEAKMGIRIGGFSTFNLKFAHEAISEILRIHDDYWFVFVNTEKFLNHPRIIYLDEIRDDQEKSNLIASASFMIHARLNGESFGLAILEAMFLGVPVLAWAGGTDRNHTRLLSGKSLYRNKRQLIKQMTLIDNYHDIEANRIKAKNFSPEIVMEKFCSTFNIEKES